MSLLLATVLAASLSSSGADPLSTHAAAASASATAAVNEMRMLSTGATLPMAQSPLQTLAIGGSASTQRVAAFPHMDFASQGLGVEPVAGLEGPAGLGSDTGLPLVRRQEGFGPVAANVMRGTARSQIMADEVSRGLMTSRDLLGSQRHESENEESERGPHKYAYQEDPRFTPEAIFANKRIAPELAEFLGHLAQRTRVNQKEVSKAARMAGLISQGRGKVSNPSDEDDSDDIEDMKRAAATQAKATPLAHFFDHLDTKTTAASWIESECAAISKNITNKYMQMSHKAKADWGSAGPVGLAGNSEIHTGMFFRHWGIDKDVMKTAARKFRLGVLSFLATQDAAKVKLHIWTDLDRNDKVIKEMLGPIAHHAEFMDAINITTFDPKVEFAKVPPTLARETLAERYKKDTMPELRSDLYRAIILYNYGGLWMDADTVLMQDVAPLLGEDWAYLVKGKEGAIEGALMSASSPKSHFTNAYLISMVMREPPIDLEMEKQKPLLAELFSNDPAHTTMHVLPPCFVDGDSVRATAGTAVLSSGTSLGSDFFGKAVALPYREYFSFGVADAMKDNSTTEVSVLQDPSFVRPSDSDHEQEDDEAPTSPSWAYHWRGNFGAPWARGSLADVAERTFMQKLQLKNHH